ncbi:MAG: TonB-dependent receptor [Caulobacteraceae bacterium]|nr:TonB-dependent receptor [Caulobacteraceae bacterium]
MNLGIQRPARRTFWLAGAAMAAALSASPALAQAARAYDIPAQSASEGIRTLARDSGLQVIAPSEDVAGVRTKAVRGEYEPTDALRAMLAGTGLEVVETGPGVVTVRRTTGAVAAASDTEVTEVLVTGSRIPRAGYDTLEAATVVGEQQIERRAYTNVLQALQDTPGFGAPGNSALQPTQGNMSVAQSFANFFGLGSQRTLTLVNGRRYVSSNSVTGSGGLGTPGSQVDLNLIPTGLISRVETVAIGGAPTYGSDAIAGTVNIILKDDFEGVQARAQYGVSDRNDAESQTYGVLMGGNFADGRGNATLSAEYSKQNGMLLSERMPFYQLLASGNTDRTDGIPAQTVIEDFTYAPATEGGLPYKAAFPMPGQYIVSNGQPLQFGPNGDLVPFNLGTIVQAASGIPIATSGGDGLKPADHFSLLSPTERYLLNANARYELSDQVTAFVEAAYANTRGEKLSDLYQFAAPAILGGPSITLSVNNPFLSDQARGILAANGVTGNFQLNRNLNDIADREPATTELDVYRIVFGFEGAFEGFGGETYSWDIAYNYGRSKNISGFNLIDRTRFLRAIDAVRNPAGEIVCGVNANASAADDDARCVALNIFGEGASSQEAVDYVVDRGQGTSINSLEQVTANLTGRLPFGIADNIAFAIGAERRQEKGSFDPDLVLETGITLLGPGVNAFAGIEGQFTTTEAYAETIVPLVNDEMAFPIVKAAEFQGAIRYVDHSITGGDVTWSAGGRVEPRLGGWGEGLVLRGVYTRAIRSPAITELFLGSVGIAGNTQDVCAANRYNIGPNPAVRAANCAAALQAVGGPAPQSFNPTTISVSAFGFRSGNPQLENEQAKSWSVGFVYVPALLPGFRAAIDYSNIRLTDAISNLTLPQLQSACYDSPNFPNESACSAFTRYDAAGVAARPPGSANRIAGDIADGYQTGFFNTASRKFEGVIGDFEYTFDLGDMQAAWEGAGAMRFGLKALYIMRDDRVALPGSPTVKAAGTVGTPRWQVQGGVGWQWNRLTTDAQVVWTSSSVSDRLATVEDLPSELINFPDYTRVDLSIGYEILDNLTAQVSIRNLFDKGLPYGAEVTRTFSPYDPIGRSYTFRLSASF